MDRNIEVEVTFLEVFEAGHCPLCGEDLVREGRRNRPTVCPEDGEITGDLIEELAARLRISGRCPDSGRPVKWTMPGPMCYT